MGPASGRASGLAAMTGGKCAVHASSLAWESGGGDLVPLVQRRQTHLTESQARVRQLIGQLIAVSCVKDSGQSLG